MELRMARCTPVLEALVVREKPDGNQLTNRVSISCTTVSLSVTTLMNVLAEFIEP